MESKELIKILNQTRRTLDISLTAEQVEELINDLEILEAIKNKAQNNNFFKGCLLRMFVEIEYEKENIRDYFKTKKTIKDEYYEIIKEWLDNDK